jgi:hypothetical protein
VGAVMVANLPYDSLSSSFVNFLSANSTTINSGLYSPVKVIGKFVPGEISIWATQFPAISVNLLNTEETRTSIGTYANTTDNQAMFSFDVGCHIRDIKAYSTTITEMQKMAANVASVIRSDMTASSTFSYLEVEGVQFQETVLADRKTYQKNCIIKVKCIINF